MARSRMPNRRGPRIAPRPCSGGGRGWSWPWRGWRGSPGRARPGGNSTLQQAGVAGSGCADLGGPGRPSCGRARTMRRRSAATIAAASALIGKVVTQEVGAAVRWESCQPPGERAMSGVASRVEMMLTCPRESATVARHRAAGQGSGGEGVADPPAAGGAGGQERCRRAGPLAGAGHRCPDAAGRQIRRPRMQRHQAALGELGLAAGQPGSRSSAPRPQRRAVRWRRQARSGSRRPVVQRVGAGQTAPPPAVGRSRPCRCRVAGAPHGRQLGVSRLGVQEASQQDGGARGGDDACAPTARR